jgi:hypothetical protein
MGGSVPVGAQLVNVVRSWSWISGAKVGQGNLRLGNADTGPERQPDHPALNPL